VNLRKGPSTSYARVAVAAKGDKCYIIGINQGWYKVIYKESICYIRSDFLELTEFPYENRQSANTPKFYRGGKSIGIAPSAAALNTSSSSSQQQNNTNVTGAQILAKAQQYLGTPYVYGGASPSGFDCSGFVYYVLKTAGYPSYRMLVDMYGLGSYVSKANLQPGDVVFFANTYGSGLSHAGIYVGNGQFIHAPNSSRTVSYDTLASGYWANHYYGARRMG
jgi:cell wall-associated NlpC family hydrolase